MITIFNTETAHKYGDIFPRFLACRYQQFVEREGYDVPVYNRMEFDQYDTPAAIYLAHKNEAGEIKAGLRLLPTNRPYMTQELWPQAVQNVTMPQRADVWETTRFFMDTRDKSLDVQKAHGEILCAMLEFALHCGIKNYIGVAPKQLWRHTVRKCGWPAAPVGEPVEIGFSEKIQSCIIDVSHEILGNVRTKMGIAAPVFSNLSALINKAVLMSDKNAYILSDSSVVTKAGAALPRREDRTSPVKERQLAVA